MSDVAVELPKKKNSRPPLCRFFNTKKGCRSGDECHFRHVERFKKTKDSLTDDVASSEPDLSPTSDPTQQTSQRRPRPPHQIPSSLSHNSTNRKPIPKPTPSETSSPLSQRASELAQLQRRFHSSFSLHSDRVSFNLSPTDPDFPFDVGYVRFSITCPETYPTSALSNVRVDRVVSTNGRDAVVPGFVLRNVEREVERRVEEGKGTILALSNWIDRNLERMMGMPDPNAQNGRDEKQHDDRKKEESRVKKEEDGGSGRVKVTIVGKLQRPAVPAERRFEVNIPMQPLQKDNEVSVLDRKPELKNEEQTTRSLDTPHRGIVVSLLNTQIFNVSLFHIACITMSLRCGRCKTPFEGSVILHGDLIRKLSPESKHARAPLQHSKTCSKCHNIARVRFRPILCVANSIQEGECKVGYIDCEDGVIEDVLWMDVWPTCEVCSTDAFTQMDDDETVTTPKRDTRQVILQKLVRGKKNSASCWKCHARMSIHTEDVRMVKIGQLTGFEHESRKPSAPAEATKKTSRRKDPSESQIVIGQPLPNQGTCGHYKKSYRWFRFPCCGHIRAFPCDKCHVEFHATAPIPAPDPLPMANRMICGFCSREQTCKMDTTACQYCEGRVSTSGRRTQFWEGGKGVRDPTLMSRNDPRKYRRRKQQ